MEVGEWLQKNMQILLSTPVAWLGLVIGALLLPPSKMRRTINTTIGITIMLELSFIAWVAYRQIVKAAMLRPPPRPTPTAQPRPRTSPSPPNQAATPQPSPPADRGETETPGGVQFDVSSRSDPAIHAEYCLDGEFEGETSTDSDSVYITLSKAKFDLCKYSPINRREVQFQVGIGKIQDIRNSNKKAIIWSKPPVVGEITAGQPLDLAPHQLSFKKNQLVKKSGQVNLSEYGIIFRVYNPERHGQYFLSCVNAFPPH